MKNLFVVLLVLCAGIRADLRAAVFPAGCMDPLAVNYNPEATEDDGSCVYETVELGLTLIGGNEVCAGEELSFVITGASSLSAGSELVIHFSDGGAPLTFPMDALPEYNTFSYAFLLTSCGSISANGLDNAFTVSITAYENGVEYAWDTVDPIYVSGPSAFAQTGLFQSPPSGPYCINQNISFVNYSLGYYLVDATGCSQDYSVSFFTEASEVFIEEENTAFFPEFIEMSFLQQGTFEVGVTLEGGCLSESSSVFVEIGPVEGNVSLWASSQGPFVPVADMKINLYEYGLQPMEFISYEISTDNQGLAAFGNVPQGIYLARATPEGSIPEQSNLISTFTNEVVFWSQANLISVGCNTQHKDTIFLKTQAPPSSFDGAANGRLVIRDPAPGFPTDDNAAEVRSFVEGDPIPGIPIIIGKDTAQAGVPFFIPIGMQLSSDGPLTGDQGFFDFSGLPEGSYRIHVDMPGLPMAQTYFFTMDDNNVIWDELNFYADLTDAIYTSDPVNILEKESNDSWVMFPNPFIDFCTVLFENDVDPVSVVWSMFDNSGRIVHPRFASLTREKMNIDGSNLPAGFYILSIGDKNQVKDFKILKY